MIGILDHATYSNITELRRSFYVDTVAPYLTSIEDAEQVQLIQPEPAWKREGVFNEFDMGEILKPDPLQEAQSIMLLTSSGTTSTNDNRKLKRPDPIGDPSRPGEPVQPSARAGEPARPLGAGRHRATSTPLSWPARCSAPPAPDRTRRVTSEDVPEGPAASSGR